MKGERDFLKISASIYHREYVPDETVFKLAGSFYQIFGKKARIDCEFHEDGEKKHLKKRFKKITHTFSWLLLSHLQRSSGEI